MRDRIVHILWDASHIWGIMAWRAMVATGLPCRLVKSTEIAQGVLLGKRPPALLVAPGGSARQKSRELGRAGQAAIRAWLANGGVYLGFCGGAGLALSGATPEDGLGICPWRRADYSQRIYHMLSGHVLATGPDNSLMPLPIWWPGRFAPEICDAVNVLARYYAPTPDLWLADLQLSAIPRRVMGAWKKTRGLDPTRDFPAGQPLVISGAYERGRYLLSYAHLETPASYAANAWLGSLVEKFCNCEGLSLELPAWNLASMANAGAPISTRWQNREEIGPTMAQMRMALLGLMHRGEELGLLFKRTSWLWGWHNGFPGMAWNNLLAAIATMETLRPQAQAKELWRRAGGNFCLQMRLLLKKMEYFMWSARLEHTLEKIWPHKGAPAELRGKSAHVFGQPMAGGGLLEEPLRFVEELIYLSQPDEADQNLLHNSAGV